MQDTSEAIVHEFFDLANVVADPGIRRPIDDYGTSEIRDKMRRAYLSRGPSRLVGHNFPKTKFGADWRPFLETWLILFVERSESLRFHALGNRRGHLPRKFHLASTTTT